MNAAAAAAPSAAKAWSRALALTAPIARQPNRTLPAVVRELAATAGDAPALLSDGEQLTYRELVERSNRYARWALDLRLGKGDVVALLMPNRPEYLAAWLGVSSVGAVVALLNTQLRGASLAHCIDAASPRHVIVAAELVERLNAVRSDLHAPPGVWRDDDIARRPADPAGSDVQPAVTIDDCALYIYTSGTTGLPKAARVSHGRLMQWSCWFAGLMDVQPADRMYDCLPMYHSVGGVVAAGAVLVGGGSVVVRERFSAREFWSDVARWDCTLFQYIGELCRYLLRAPAAPQETAHRIRLCCGNGLRADVWNAFKDRFRIPRILEFYASTEGNVSLVNVEGVPGAVGRIPPFLAHRYPAALVKYDAERRALVRDARGFCIRCAEDEPGEAIGPLGTDRSNVGSWFEGYTDGAASEQKVARDVFTRGDAWFRTGDLMRRDARGYFHFVDRAGDTFRWKGENVATAEVADAICAFDGVHAATVYGVAVPGEDGRAGMAAVAAAPPFDLARFRAHLVDRLPDYARPLFLRLRTDLEITDTFKHITHALAREGYDPASIGDPLYFDDRRREAFVPLDASLYRSISSVGLHERHP